MMHTHYFRLGDPSDDGHGRHKSYVIQCNFDYKQLKLLVEQAQKTLDIDFDKWCHKYEEWRLPVKDSDILRKTGILETFFRVKEYDMDHETMQMGTGYYFDDGLDELFELWLHCLQFVDPSFKFEVIPICWWDYGMGYGLFNA
jgi:hypothetical protein